MTIEPVDVSARAIAIGAAVLVLIGIFITFAAGHLMKRLIGLSIFQSGIIVFLISMTRVTGGTVPVIEPGTEGVLYANPLPGAIVLTAIWSGVATLVICLALIMRIQEAFGTSEQDDLQAADGCNEADQRQ